MPRRPRVQLAGAPLHIIQRGPNRDACFFAEEDYLELAALAGRSPERKQLRLARLVLMTNHVHLLLTPPHPQDVPRLMISHGRRYVHYINKTYRRTGTLWDSRYKSSLVQQELGPFTLNSECLCGTRACRMISVGALRLSTLPTAVPA